MQSIPQDFGSVAQAITEQSKVLEREITQRMWEKKLQTGQLTRERERQQVSLREAINSRQLVQVTGDGVEDTVGEGLQVGDSDVEALLHLGVTESLLSTHLIGQRTDRQGQQDRVNQVSFNSLSLIAYSYRVKDSVNNHLLNVGEPVTWVKLFQ